MTAALLYGKNLHYLDHLGPLCCLMNIPLVVNDEDIFELGKKFYPTLDIRLINIGKIPDFILQNFRVLISCLTKPYLNLIFFLHLEKFQKNVQTIWCPHGNSDKGSNDSLMEPLKNEDCLLIYGPKMRDFLKKKDVLHPRRKIIQVGNYRHHYYLQHKSFYQQTVEKLFSKFKKKRETYLYAPTWEDYDQNSSFPYFFKNILKTQPHEINLVVKLHPNTWEKEDLARDKEVWSHEEKNNLLFIREFPPIYPILDKVQRYLGDFSSIGYDFLLFQKPMSFFLPSNKTWQDSDLFQCGELVSKNTSFFTHGQKEDLIAKQKYLYHYTFQEDPNWINQILSL